MNTPKLILAECRNWFEDVHSYKDNCSMDGRGQGGSG